MYWAGTKVHSVF